MESEMHVDELAELYAAGMLDEREGARVEAHVTHCDECLRRVGEAEETVLALERRFKAGDEMPAMHRLTLARRRRPYWWAAPAVAAALVVGWLLPRPEAFTNPATLAMIHSHFSHAQFTGVPAAPPAKVLYARDRSWYYVIVEGRYRFGVYGIANRHSIDLGSTTPNGDTSALFSAARTPFERLELRSRGALVEAAAIR
jgi:hypothetical protein